MILARGAALVGGESVLVLEVGCGGGPGSDGTLMPALVSPGRSGLGWKVVTEQSNRPRFHRSLSGRRRIDRHFTTPCEVRMRHVLEYSL